MGEWVVNAHKVNKVNEFDHLLKYVFSLTKKFNVPLMSFDDDPAFPSAEFEQGEVYDYINEYDEDTFWDELSNRLVDRIFAEQFTPKEIQSMEMLTRFEHMSKIEGKVNSYLQTHGIDQISVNI